MDETFSDTMDGLRWELESLQSLCEIVAYDEHSNDFHRVLKSDIEHVMEQICETLDESAMPQALVCDDEFLRDCSSLRLCAIEGNLSWDDPSWSAVTTPGEHNKPVLEHPRWASYVKR